MTDTQTEQNLKCIYFSDTNQNGDANKDLQQGPHIVSIKLKLILRNYLDYTKTIVIAVGILLYTNRHFLLLITYISTVIV